MANTVLSTNMSLPVPVVGVDPGPDWASNINSCLSIIDAHDHTVGNGVQITPNGLNINAELAFNDNNAISLKSVRFTAQNSPLAGASDLGCLYESGVDLYYNDGAGNQVRITQSGGVAGSPGSIAGLSSPASATYVSGSSTFVWQSAASTPANMDGASFIIRNLTASSNGITVSAPGALASNFTITLPLLPASNLPLSIDNTGAMSAAQISTAQIADSAVTTAKIADANVTTVKIADSNVTTAKIADANVTIAKMAAMTASTTATAGNIALSNSCGPFSASSVSYIDVPNLSVTITTTGRPVQLMLVWDGGSSQSSIKVQRTSGGGEAQGNIKILRGGSTLVYFTTLAVSALGASAAAVNFPVGSIQQIDTAILGSAGSYTYKVQVNVDTSASSFVMDYIKLLAYEI